MLGEGVDMSSTADRGAVFVLPLRAATTSGPVAAWATTGGWARGAEQVLGRAWVVSDGGVLDPRETLSQVTVIGHPSPSRLGWRAHMPEPPITLAKDLRRAISGWRRTRAIDATRWLEEDIAFVWQRHEFARRCGARLAGILGVPFVLSVHSLQIEEARGWGVRRPGWSRFAERFGELPQLRRADVVACVSEGVADLVCRRGIDERRVLVTPNGVDTERFRPVERDPVLAERLGLTGRFVVGWSGSFRGFHGLDQALAAMEWLADEQPDITLVLFGDGQQRRTLEAEVASRGLRSVVFAGAVPFEDMPRHLALCDAALVLAPVTGSFHYSPVKLREYLASGLPVVAHAAGELAAGLRHEQHALLVERGDAAALARALVRLRVDAGLRERLSRQGPELARERWSWQGPVRQVLDALADRPTTTR
jgi:glycosyltransferase involved in cell wall biosynthesis